MFCCFGRMFNQKELTTGLPAKVLPATARTVLRLRPSTTWPRDLSGAVVDDDLVDEAVFYSTLKLVS